MVEGLIGRKIAMTQVFDEEGRVIPCTVLQVGPCVVVQRREKARDGYEAVQLGLVEPVKVKPRGKVLVSLFKTADRVDIVGTSKGKGFQGVMKRHHFRGGAASHGSMFHRAPGSIGASAYPSRTFRGMRMGGRMGGDRVTVKNLEVVRVDEENNLLVVRGAVPGATGAYLSVRRSRAPIRIKKAPVAPKAAKKKG